MGPWVSFLEVWVDEVMGEGVHTGTLRTKAGKLGSLLVYSLNKRFPGTRSFCPGHWGMQGKTLAHQFIRSPSAHSSLATTQMPADCILGSGNELVGRVLGKGTPPKKTTK